MKHGLAAGLALLMLLLGQLSWAAGSWISEVSGPRVAVPGRSTPSALLAPPDSALAAGRQITRVTWRLAQAVPVEELQMRLCRNEHCVALPGVTGSSQAWRGQPADAPLHFRFRLAQSRQRAIQVPQLQVVVEYR